MPAVGSDRLAHCYAVARDALLAEIAPSGHWQGELSTSALSTATAVMALEMVRRGAECTGSPGLLPQLVERGLHWLAEHQNDDGGWGDTVTSLSNISTTFLARAVFRATGTEDQYRNVVDRSVAYLDRAGGVPAVIARYGKDRTFSVPILTHCALAGLVDWRAIPSLPFELACLPPRFYKTVRLPVVSYALPALIAIGQVRHHHAPTRNPFLRPLRHLAASPSLRVLERIQPTNGGFLEAAPLTSFVTMSLAGMGLAKHPVAQRGTQFLIDSVRPDGSWPIDTNLATWVTTLSVNALGDDVPEEHREPILRWLIDQQYKTLHAYTNADPGGWAWTDLPGGVPDADDTAGAVLAVLRLIGAAGAGIQRSDDFDADLVSNSLDSVEQGVQWLLNLQNRNGGWPTFCRGWGKLPFDRSSQDITAHALRALYGFQSDVHHRLKHGNERLPRHCLRSFNRANGAIAAGWRYLESAQRSDGTWLPLWFGNQHSEDDENATYGTAKVLAAGLNSWTFGDAPHERRGLVALGSLQNADGGWGAGPGTPSSVEETALAVEVLLADLQSHEAASRGAAWLCDRIEDGSWREPAPIGFYFAK